jgi:hypothetical protein
MTWVYVAQNGKLWRALLNALGLYIRAIYRGQLGGLSVCQEDIATVTIMNPETRNTTTFSKGIKLTP